VLTVANMPHHSSVPRWTALTLASIIVVAGIVAAIRPRDVATAQAGERKRLLARREKLLNELVRLERERRSRPAGEGASGAAGRPPASRREEIVAALEQVYGALDSDDIAPGPGTTSGVAA
jgi:hypothetical protein